MEKELLYTIEKDEHTKEDIKRILEENPNIKFVSQKTIKNTLKKRGHTMEKELLYTIEKDEHTKEDIKRILEENPNIKFVSLMGVDLGGNATDEKIPVKFLLDDIDDFLASAVQTDGS